VLLAVAACLAVAALSFLLEPFALLPDPWAWVVWGRELEGFDLNTVSGPSWKPLPPLVLAVLSPTGAAAPVLWELIARAGALLALVMAWRVARRLAGPVAAWIAAAAVGLALLPSWANIAAMGREEGLLCALILWSVERHLERREAQAFVLGFAAALLRPEVWPFLGLYGAWLLWRRPPLRALVIGLGLALAPLWFLPDIVTAGDPLKSSQKAQGGISGTTLTEPVKRAYELVPPALQLAALAAAVIAFLAVRRSGLRAALRGHGLSLEGELVPAGERELTVLALFAGALGWVALVAVTSKVANYAGISRFQHPAAAIVGVLAGVGSVWAAEALRPVLARRAAPRLARSRSPAVPGFVGEAVARRRAGGPAGALAAGLVAGVLLAGTLPTIPARERRVRYVIKVVDARSDHDRTLGDAVTAAGGRAQVRACGTSYTNPGNEPALAWRLHRHIEDVKSDAPAVPGAVFRVDTRALRTATVRRLGIRLFGVADRTFDPVARTGMWEVLAACRPGVTLGREGGR
jgi:hypothetical protein